MSGLSFSPSAQRDLHAILEYIARDNPGAALQHIERMEETCRWLAKNPMIGSARDDLVPFLRSYSVGKYVVFFRPANDGIEVIRVVHGARDIDNIFL